MNGIPIDYDKDYYARARASVRAQVETEGEGQDGVDVAEQRMYERYYDQQYEMLVALRPRIVGHFDLIRLMSTDPGRDVRRWPGVWNRIVRNLSFVASYGGWLECNSSALRKGLDEPYPCRVIAEVSSSFCLRKFSIPKQSRANPGIVEMALAGWKIHSLR